MVRNLCINKAVNLVTVNVTKSGIDFAIHLLAKDDIISGDKTLL